MKAYPSGTPMISRALGLTACRCLRPATVYMRGRSWCRACFKALELRREAQA